MPFSSNIYLKKMHHVFFGTILGCIIIFILYFYYDQEKNTGKPLIICTTSILAQTVSELAGNWAQVESLMGADVDPHLYKPRSGDVFKLEKAHCIIYHGLHLEGKMADILELLKAQNKFVYNSASEIPSNVLRAINNTGMYDPHIWFDIQIWRKVVKNIAIYLQKTFPKHHESIDECFKKYDQKLDILFHWTCKQLDSIHHDRRILITAHDAFGYFGKAHNIRVEGLQGISTDAEIRMLDIERIANIILTHRIPTIFVEKTIPEKYLRGVQELVRRNDFDVTIGEKLYSDALGEHGSHAATYIGMIEHNVRALVKGLNHDS